MTTTLEKSDVGVILDVVARRRSGVWRAELLRYDIEGKGSSRDEAVGNALEELKARRAAAPGDLRDTPVRAAVMAFVFLLIARIASDTEFLRIPVASDLDETSALLRDSGVLADLEASERDVEAGRVITLDDLKRELGRG